MVNPKQSSLVSKRQDVALQFVFAFQGFLLQPVIGLHLLLLLAELHHLLWLEHVHLQPHNITHVSVSVKQGIAVSKKVSSTIVLLSFLFGTTWCGGWGNPKEGAEQPTHQLGREGHIVHDLSLPHHLLGWILWLLLGTIYMLGVVYRDVR